MDCRKVRDMLLTDYLDNELDLSQAAGIERHLTGCARCREVLENVRAVSLKGEREIAPSAVVWQKIRERIEDAESRQTGWLERVGDVLAPLLTAPRLALSASFMAVLVFIAVLFLKGPSGDVGSAYAYLEEQMTVMEELHAGEPEVSNGELNGYVLLLED